MGYEFTQTNQLPLPDYEEGYRPTQMGMWEDTLYTLRVTRPVATVHTNYLSLWRPDNRFPGEWSVMRHTPGVLKIQPSASRYGAKEPKPTYIHQHSVDKLIHLLLALRSWDEQRT